MQASTPSWRPDDPRPEAPPLAGYEAAASHLSTRRCLLEWGLLLAAAPFLAFPASWPAFVVTTGVVGVALLATLRPRQAVAAQRRAGHWRIPLGVLSVSAIVGAAVSPYPDLTLPKLSGLVLGLLIWRTVLVTGTTEARVRWITWTYLAAGVVVVLVGLGGMWLGPDYSRKSQSFIFALSARIPRVIPPMPGAEAGVNPNALGGTSLFFLPLFAGLCWYAASRSAGPDVRVATRLARISCLIGAGLVVAVLILSQSRSAWSAAAVAGIAVLLLRFRRAPLLWAAAASLALALVVSAWTGTWSPAGLLEASGRAPIWRVAWEALRDRPATGVGLGAFRRLAEATPTDVDLIGHAHNVFLQVALDVGVPGLLAYLAFLGLATHATFRTIRGHGPPLERVIAAGLWGGLVAVHVFGLTDAIALGAKVGAFLWWNLGLIAALGGLTGSRAWAVR